MFPSLVLACCRRLGKITTAYHLWCAELELRWTDTTALSASQKQARERNLDLLREYRRRGEFPRNRHDPKRYAPCFIDSDGQRCAVAALLHASGNELAALKVRDEANFARIRNMHFAELDEWAEQSGLTKAELARIQPAYAPTPEQLLNAWYFIYIVWAIGAFALFSIIANTVRTFASLSRSFTTSLIGVVAGILLLALSSQYKFASDLAYSPRLWDKVTAYQIVAAVLGIGSLAMGIVQLIARPAPGDVRPPPKPLANLEPETGFRAGLPSPSETGIREIE